MAVVRNQRRPLELLPGEIGIGLAPGEKEAVVAVDLREIPRQAVAAGALSLDDIAGDLLELTRGERSGRRFYDQITLFKSVGTAIEDLAAAQLVCERY